MKVVEVVGTLQTGGAENQVVQLLNGWNAERIEKHLVCFTDSDTDLSRAVGSDVKRFHVKLAPRGQVGCILRLAKLLRRIRPDVVQAHMFHTNLYAALAAKLANVPVYLTTEHGKNLWKNKLHHALERHVVSPLATLRIAVSEDIRQVRVKRGDVPDGKTMVIPPCVEIPEKRVDLNDRSPVRIGAIGRMVSAKDYPTLVRAFAHVLSSGLRSELIFLGDGPDRALLEQMTSELGIEECVSFPGFQADVGKWLRGFDIVVFSSVREGIPVAMLEAMAAGVPIVATRVGGIPEVISNGVEGLLVDSGDPAQLAHAITVATQDLGLRRKLGTRGRQKVSSLYSRTVICERYEQLFRELLAQVAGDSQWR